MGSKGSNTVSQNQVTTPNPAVAQAGTTALGMATTAAQTPFQQPAAPVAPFSGAQMSGFNTVDQLQGMTNPYFNSANLLNMESAAPITGADVGQYFNPMAGNVTAQLQNIFGQQQQNVTGQLTQAAGGVGADRIAVGQAELSNQQALAAGQTYANLYQQALQAAENEKARQSQAGFGEASFGPAAQGATLQAAGAQLNTGGLQQQEQQAILNSPYQQTLARLAYPFQTAQFLGGVTGGLGGVMGSQTQGTTTYPAPNPFSQALGLGVAGAGLYGQAGGFQGWGQGKGGGGGGYDPNTAFGGYNVTGLGPAGLPAAAGGGRQMADGGDPGNAAQPGVEMMSEAPYGEDKFTSVVPNIPITPHPLRAPSLPSAKAPSGGGGSGGGDSGIMGDIGAGVKIAATLAPLFLAADGGAVETMKGYLSGLGSLTTKDEPIGTGAGGIRGAQGGAVGPFAALQGFASGGSPYDDMFSAKEQQYGLPSGYLSKTARIESGYNPRNTNKSGAAGLFQFIPSTAHQYGLSNPYDPSASTDAAARLAAANRNYLKAGLGRDPTAGELYLAHQQGPNGAIKLLTNPNAPAVALVGQGPVVQNGGHPGMTGGEFASKWTNQFEGGGGYGGGSSGDGGGGTHLAFNDTDQSNRQQAGKDFSSSPWSGVTKLGLDMYNKASTFARGGMADGGEPDDEPPPMPNPDNPNDPEPPPEEQGARYAGLAGPVPYPTADIKSPGQDFARSPWAALTAAGLGIAAGKSPFALSNIGAGGLEGMKFLENQRKDIREEQGVNLRAKALMQQAQFHADQYAKPTANEAARLAMEKYKVDKDSYYPPVFSPYGDVFTLSPKRPGLAPRVFRLKEDGTVTETTTGQGAPDTTTPTTTTQPQQPQTAQPANTSISPSGGVVASNGPDSLTSTPNVGDEAQRNPAIGKMYFDPKARPKGQAVTAAAMKQLSTDNEAAQRLDVRAQGIEHSIDVIKNAVDTDPTGRLRLLLTPGTTGPQRMQILNAYTTAMNAAGKHDIADQVSAAVNAWEKERVLGGFENIKNAGLSAREAQPIIQAAIGVMPSFGLPEQASRFLTATMHEIANRQNQRTSFFNSYRAKNGGFSDGWEEAYNKAHPPQEVVARASYSVLPQAAKAELPDAINELRKYRDAYMAAERGDPAQAQQALATYNKAKANFDKRYNGLGNYFAFGTF